MQFRQKLAYMALGGVLVLAGHVLSGLVVPPADAQEGLQDAKFRNITADELLIGERSGAHIRLHTDLWPSIYIVGTNHEYEAQMFANDTEASLAVSHIRSERTAAVIERTAVVIQVAGTKEGLLLIARDDTALAVVTGDNDGGIISVSDKYGDLRDVR